MAKDWLDQEGRFLFGQRHRGEYAEDVVRTDPGYLRWIIDGDKDISDTDYEILRDLLSRTGELNP